MPILPRRYVERSGGIMDRFIRTGDVAGFERAMEHVLGSNMPLADPFSGIGART